MKTVGDRAQNLVRQVVNTLLPFKQIFEEENCQQNHVGTQM